MNAIERILCPVDFSEPSEHAMRYAVDLAERLGAELHLVHVFQIPAMALPDGAIMGGPDWTTRIMERSEQSLKELAARHADQGIDVKTHLVEGVPFREINRVAREDVKADLIVIGTHGRTGLSHLLMGSVAERVVRTSDVPVITVPRGA